MLSRAATVKESLWIGTADIKDLYFNEEPFLKVLSDLVRKGVNVRLIHAKEPGQVFRDEFDRYPALFKGLERLLCPRTHFKIMVFDYRSAYVGSANLTGAGIGMKGENKRNFEAGILTDEPELLDAITEQFDSLWRGDRCKQCLRKAYCPAPIK